MWCTSLVVLAKGIVTVGVALLQYVQAIRDVPPPTSLNAPFAPRWLALLLGMCGFFDILYHKWLRDSVRDVWVGSILSCAAVIVMAVVGATAHAVAYPVPLVLSAIIALVFLGVFSGRYRRSASTGGLTTSDPQGLNRGVEQGDEADER